jgi:hypothetical protein
MPIYAIKYWISLFEDYEKLLLILITVILSIENWIKLIFGRRWLIDLSVYHCFVKKWPGY